MGDKVICPYCMKEQEHVEDQISAQEVIDEDVVYFRCEHCKQLFKVACGAVVRFVTDELPESWRT